MREKFIKKIFLSVLFFTLLLLFPIDRINAQEGLKLRISPPLLEIDLEPGTSYSDYIKFTNLDELESVTLYPQLVSFKALGDDGGQEFVDATEEDATYSLARWINVSMDTLEIGTLRRAHV